MMIMRLMMKRAAKKKGRSKENQAMNNISQGAE